MINVNSSHGFCGGKKFKIEKQYFSYFIARMAQELPKTNLITLFLLLIGKRQRFKVVGRSMLPLLKPKEEILIDPWAYRKHKPQINDVILTNHPYDDRLKIVKRVVWVADDDSYFLLGDNLEASTDSRHWGRIDRQKIVGRVTNRFI